ncbi:TonB-dependent receptor plug domain-containing protein [Hydrogenimonas cancrithermarum]|uniref:TonB-dependent receptor n=1 Tax=Hydrogenimonas cancrithermarum TaxID=2993563 RepID=A0ABM8FL42_9BACT|nr:TonB-dependent receptor [Hydrogenimonas cancrithermarum]BDY12108.1 hypothetical protein HCR_04200 [Hydrogenimonas cancrithermarum]
MKRVILSVLLAGFPLLASEDLPGLAQELIKDMKRVGMLAESVKMNESYQPYIVTVFSGKDLEKIGVSNLQEALELVPGVDMATDNLDNKRAVFRGSNPYAYGQSKLFVDGVEVNDILFDSYGSFLSMPIEMIKRIEVTRGPGSVSDGYNAYAGSIRVITYAEHSTDDETSSDRVVAKAGGYGYVMGGFTKAYKGESFNLFTDFYYQKDDKMLPAGPDALSHDPLNAALSKRGEAPLWMRNYSLGIQLDYEDVTLRARTLYNERGSAYGINGALPPKDDHAKFPLSYAEISYHPFWDEWRAFVKAGWKDSAFKSSSRLIPPGFVAGGIEYENGFYGEHVAKIRKFYQTAYAEYDGLEGHRLNMGYYVDYSEIYKVVTKTTDRSTGTGIVDYSESRPFIEPNSSQHTYRLFFQDRIQYDDALSFQIGLNIEKVSDISTEINPRVSAVYQQDGKNIYKAIYSRSSRSPSWQELFTINNHARIGNPDLDPEVVNAFELAYIHKFSVDAFLQLNLFYLQNSDQIDNVNDDNIYLNSSETNIYGFEFEFRAPLGLHDTLYANYSYVYGKENGSHPLSDSARHMAKGYYIHQFDKSFDFSLIGKYVGSKERTTYDYREKLDSYATLDMTFGYAHANDLTLRLSVKNLFDATVKYPSPPYNYDEDFIQEGRKIIVTLTKGF